ncbi:MAG TPA: DUF4384 domain-containing protein [Candidatus Tectomicrobia bacterium]
MRFYGALFGVDHTTRPGRRVSLLWALALLGLALTWRPDMASAQAQNEENIDFLWAFVALVDTGSAKKQLSITQDVTLKTGDQLKMSVEPRKPCFVYVIYHGSQGEVRQLFPYTPQQFTTDYQPAKKYDIPPGDAWFRLDDQVGRETFYLLASAQRLSELETLLENYTAAPAAEQSQLATNIVAEIRDMRRRQRQLATPAERPVPIAGNMREDAQALEIKATNFYSKTFTIEHEHR